MPCILQCLCVASGLLVTGNVQGVIPSCCVPTHLAASAIQDAGSNEVGVCVSLLHRADHPIPTKSNCIDKIIIDLVMVDVINKSCFHFANVLTDIAVDHRLKLFVTHWTTHASTQLGCTHSSVTFSTPKVVVKRGRDHNFIKKIESHPGIDSPKFLGEYQDSTGRMLKCYHLPEREAHLMVMSESLAVQTQVYDRCAASAAPMSRLQHHPSVGSAGRSERLPAGHNRVQAGADGLIAAICWN